MRRTCALGVVLTGCLVAVLGADDWPHWRGPSASGVSPERGLPVRWSDTRERRVEGAARRARRVVADRLGRSRVRDVADRQRRRASRSATRAGRQPARGRRAAARRRAHQRRRQGHVSRQRVQSHQRPAERGSSSCPPKRRCPPVHEKHNLASPSPVTDGERVYAWFATGQIAAVDLNGQLVWKKHLGAEYGAVRDQLGARQLAGGLQGPRSSCCAITNARRTCWRSTPGPARCAGRPTRPPASRRTARRWSSKPAAGRRSS